MTSGSVNVSDDGQCRNPSENEKVDRDVGLPP
jgi:hypothetical protein